MFLTTPRRTGLIAQQRVVAEHATTCPRSSPSPVMNTLLTFTTSSLPGEAD